MGKTCGKWGVLIIYLKIPQELGGISPSLEIYITQKGSTKKSWGFFSFSDSIIKTRGFKHGIEGLKKLYRFTEYQLQNVGFNQKRKVNHTCRIEAATNCSFTNRNGYITCKMLSNMKWRFEDGCDIWSRQEFMSLESETIQFWGSNDFDSPTWIWKVQKLRYAWTFKSE